MTVVTGVSDSPAQSGDSPNQPLGPTPEQRLAARLNDPVVADSLLTLLDHADLLAVLVVGLDQLVARSEVIGDSVLGGIAELRGAVQTTDAERRLDPAAIAQAMAAVGMVLPKVMPGIVAAVESGAADRLLGSPGVPGAIDDVDLVFSGVAEGSKRFRSNPVRIRGLMSATKAFRNPDVQRALSYFATITKSIGERLAERRAP
ncbi:DUF1641 domain-containing protein [Tsukamurella soli]|uniref:DUF1641 domain-containing protein n=1 Tax=Tsukamurella soli TaxID=644556 RepID=A0ABP8K2T9_9ACTN